MFNQNLFVHVSTLSEKNISTYYISSDDKTYAKEAMENFNEHDLCMQFTIFDLILKALHLWEDPFTGHENWHS